jgi:hypothetical protein
VLVTAEIGCNFMYSGWPKCPTRVNIIEIIYIEKVNHSFLGPEFFLLDTELNLDSLFHTPTGFP